MEKTSDTSREYSDESSRSIAEIVVRAQEGDRDATAELWQRTRFLVRSQLVRWNSNHMDIEDLSQDVYVQVVRNLHVLRHPETFESWIVKICQRLSINFSARKKLRATQQLPFLPESDEVVVYDESPTSLEVLLGESRAFGYERFSGT